MVVPETVGLFKIPVGTSVPGLGVAGDVLETADEVSYLSGNVPKEDDSDSSTVKDVAMEIVTLQQDNSYELEDTDEFNYELTYTIDEFVRMAQDEANCLPTVIEEAAPTVTEESKGSHAMAPSTRAQREDSRKRSPWHRRWKRPFKRNLAPFGSKVIFLNDGTFQALGKPLKYEPRGRVGVLVGYGPMGSFLVLDHRMYCEKNRIILKPTRDCRLYFEEFPLAAIQSITAQHLGVVDVMEKEFKGDTATDDNDFIIQGGLRFNGKLGEKCKTCDKWIMAPETKPRCGRCLNPNSKVKHQYGDRCKIGWCKGHASVEGEPGNQPQVAEVSVDQAYPDLDPVPDSEVFHDAEGGEPQAPVASAPPAASAPSSSTSGMGDALQRPLDRTAQVMGTGAAVGAAHAVGLGPVGTTIAGALSEAIGESVANAVLGLINPSSASSSSPRSVTPGTGVTVGQSVVYPHQAVHNVPGDSGRTNIQLPDWGTSGGSSSSVSRAGASGMLARTLKMAFAGALRPTTSSPTRKSCTHSVFSRGTQLSL